MLMPITAYFALRLVNERKLLGDAVNSKRYNVLAWACVGGGGLGSVVMVTAMIFPKLFGA
jgi:Mn2+/Fe2+ NRAMP family transporter